MNDVFVESYNKKLLRPWEREVPMKICTPSSNPSIPVKTEDPLSDSPHETESRICFRYEISIFG